LLNRYSLHRFIVASANPAPDDATIHDSQLLVAAYGNKNPRTIIRGKVAGSLPVEARKLRQTCQFNKASKGFI
jgi:hypothetical protein